jgi:hypothetical protein
MTFRDLYELMYPVCKAKIDRDTHKGDPMGEPMWDLIVGARCEWAELIEAINRFERDQSEENRQEALKEVADNINFLMFLAGKISGVATLER